MTRALGLDDEVPATLRDFARRLHVADGAGALGKAATVGGGLTADGAFHDGDSMRAKAGIVVPLPPKCAKSDG